MSRSTVEAHLDNQNQYCAAYSLTREILVFSKQPAVPKFKSLVLDQVPPIEGSSE